jgi:hypothetical protein
MAKLNPDSHNEPILPLPITLQDNEDGEGWLNDRTGPSAPPKTRITIGTRGQEKE